VLITDLALQNVHVILVISITVLLKFVTNVLTTVTLVLTLLNVPLIVQIPD
jgi:hypothetical protein